MGVRIANNVWGRLSASISAVDVVIPVDDASLFPALGVGEYTYATLINTSNQLEIVKITSIAGNNLTVERGAESTTSRPYIQTDLIEVRVTAQTVYDLFLQNSIDAAAAQAAAEAAAADAQAIADDFGDLASAMAAINAAVADAQSSEDDAETAQAAAEAAQAAAEAAAAGGSVSFYERRGLAYYTASQADASSNTITIPAGSVLDNTGAYVLTNPSTFTKIFSAVWAPGTGNGGGAVASGVGRLYIVAKVTGEVDFVASTSIAAALALTTAAGYVRARWIGNLMAAQNGGLRSIASNVNNTVLWGRNAHYTFAQVLPSGSGQNSLDVPTAVPSRVNIININTTLASSGSTWYALIQDLDVSEDVVPDALNHNLAVYRENTDLSSGTWSGMVKTDVFGKIGVRTSVPNVTNTFTYCALGFVDDMSRNIG